MGCTSMLYAACASGITRMSASKITSREKVRYLSTT